MTVYSLLVAAHVALGTTALITFWTAGLAKKGSPVHKRAGKAYLVAMAALLALAVPMTGYVIRYAPAFGVFLAYLLVISGTAVWTSWRAIRDKRDWRRYTGPVFRALTWANLGAAVTAAAFGVLFATEMQLVIVLFSAIGVVNFVQMRRFARTAPSDPRWWMKAHLDAMLGNGVATHIAFLGIGLPRLLPMIDGALLRTAAWIVPLAAAFAIGAYLTGKYLPARPVSASDRPTPVPRT